MDGEMGSHASIEISSRKRRKNFVCRIVVVPFGEAVMYKELGKDKKSMGTQWKIGIWVRAHQEQ